MDKVKLIHWKAQEIKGRETILHSAGYQVDTNIEGGSRVFTSLSEDPPAAIIIDLSRLPSQGRDFALTVRKRKGTRHIPLVFVGGDRGKVEKVKALLPDARYTTWDQINETLGDAIAHPPPNPVFHESTFAGYADKPLVGKLGIKSGMVVLIINMPAGFDKKIDPLPPNVRISSDKSDVPDLAIWFCSSRAELSNQLGHIVLQSKRGPVWIAWPKQKSGAGSDLNQQIVRKTGLDMGLVDYKISSFDDTWSGLLFRYRNN